MSFPLPNPVSTLTSFALSGDQSRVYYTGTNNHIYELRGSGNNWTFRDLTQDASNAPEAIPIFLLTSFALPGDLPRVYYAGADNHIYELGDDGTGKHWAFRDLTLAANAPIMGSNHLLTGFALPGENQQSRLYYTGADDHICELTSDGNNWGVGLLNQFGSAPVLAFSRALTGFSLQGNQPHVYYIGLNDADKNYYIYELFWDGSIKWNLLPLTPYTVGNVPEAAFSRTLTSFALPGDLLCVYYIGVDNAGDIYELRGSGNNWTSSNLTQVANAPEAAPILSLTSFALQGNQPRVYYADANNHIYELRDDGTGKHWGVGNLTLAANAPVMGSNRLLTGFALPGENQSRLYYTGADNHICELAWDGNNWTSRAITSG